ncbi:MAG: hypothetical protein DMF69_09010 [Acidobacteria bacterium]|nr:MAG: hypothetical protein DMF69_09010 [Acidobacteriota bacterium]
MRTNVWWVFLAVFAISLFSGQQARGASLTGKVIEVNDGDEITIFNLNRPVRIKLLAIDAPEKDQAFGAAAKQHLFDLVYDKVVVVEYAGIGEHSMLIGRVVLNETDVCAQMIRDGAAWFDHFNKNLLTDSQREIYSKSEEAARGERRGLWQAEAPEAPWDFVKAERERKNPVANRPAGTLDNHPVVKRDRVTPELTNLNLLRTGTSVARPSGAFDDMSWADGTVQRSWKKFQPAGENFSAFMPEGGKTTSQEVLLADIKVKVNYYVVREANSVYESLWMSGPVLGETDSEAVQSAMGGFIRGVKNGLEADGNSSFVCVPSSQRNISSAGYTGREFDLTECTIPGMMRVYTRVVGKERYIYGGAVFFRDEDANVSKFLKSFTVVSTKSVAPKSVSKN